MREAREAAKFANEMSVFYFLLASWEFYWIALFDGTIGICETVVV